MSANPAAAAGQALRDIRAVQRLRLRRTLYAGAAAAALSLVLGLLFVSGHMRLAGGGFTAVMIGFWLINAGFIAAILSNFNLRLPDPSMTLAQMIWATVSTFGFLYFVADGAYLVLMVYLLAMMFGAFRLDVSEYLLVTLIALVLYGAVISIQHRVYPDEVNLREEALNWLVFFIVMVGFSLLGSETSRLRSTLQRRNYELRTARDAAAVADAAKSRFLASISHELRTPLNMVMGAADAIGDQGLDPDQRRALDRARHAGTHLLSLVNSMIDLAKLERGNLELRPQRFDLGDQLRAIAAMFAPLAEAKALALDIDIAQDVGATVEGDPARLDEVLVHLLGNALKFTDNGRVCLQVHRDGDRVDFAVVDTGCGIDAERVETLFQPFNAQNAQAVLLNQSSGLGLALCRQLVDLMGGNLGVTSTPGEGSRFHFSLHLPALDAPVDRNDDDALARLRVLLVEDAPDNRLLVEAFIARDIARLDFAENGAEGVERFARETYDVVLMDMHMPVMDGLEATRAIRAHEDERGGPRAMVLALTADDSEKDRARSLEAGCDDHLVKPVSKKTLLAVLRDCAVRAPTLCG